MEKEEAKIIKLSISGLAEEPWNRLQDSFFNIIEKISKKIDDSTSVDHKIIESTKRNLQDLAVLTTQWAKAKIEKPTLENEMIKAEIAEKFAQTKKIFKETEKMDEEIKSIKIENNHKELIYRLDELEKVYLLMQKMNNARILFSKDEGNANLFIGANPDQYKLCNDNKQDLTIGISDHTQKNTNEN